MEKKRGKKKRFKKKEQFYLKSNKREIYSLENELVLVLKLFQYGQVKFYKMKVYCLLVNCEKFYRFEDCIDMFYLKKKYLLKLV